ncbi:MAG: hypothetical protein V3S89_12680, partial [Desulfobacterales bacterium]
GKMNVDLTAILVPLGSFATVVLIVYFISSYGYKERIEMLKMGLTPPPRGGLLRGMASLWMGLVIGAIGLALLLFQFFGYNRDELQGGIICLFIGIGLLIYYRMAAPQRERQMRLHEEHREALTRQIEASSTHGDTHEEIGTE